MPRPSVARASPQPTTLARLYRVLSRVNRAMGSVDDVTALLQVACENVVGVAGYRLAWAGVADASGAVLPLARAGHDDGYVDLLHIQLAGPRSTGPTAQALLGHAPVVCDDVATDPRMLLWRDEALARGLASSVGVPLTKGEATFGVLSVYGSTPGAFSAADVELLDELGRDLSLGLAAIEQGRERQRAEAALLDAEARLSASIETMLDPFVILRPVRDDSGRIIDFVYEDANAAACIANRMDRADLVGRRLLEVLPEHQGAGLLEAYARVMETGVPLVLDDLAYTDQWGGRRERRAFDVRANRSGDVLAYTWRDVTERRREERRRARDLERRVRERTVEVEAARERALALAHLSELAVEARAPSEVAEAVLAAARDVGGAVDGVVSLVQPGDARIEIVASFGLSSRVLEIATSSPAATLTPSRDAATRGEAVLIRGLADFEARYPGLVSLPAEVAGRFRAVAPMPGTDGPVGAVVLGFAEAPTFDDAALAFVRSLANTAAHAFERLRLAQAEEQARELLAAVIAQLPVGVSVVDAQGRIRLRNEALTRMLGRPSDYRGPVEAFGPDGEPLTQDQWPAARALAAGEVIAGEEVDVQRPDGSTARLMVTSAPLRDAFGATTGAVAVSVDVTEQRRAEGLREAFLGVLSHELRTPITTIYLGATMLALRGDRMSAEMRADMVADVAAESERLSRLVDDLLVLARVERGVDLTAAGAALVQHRLRDIARSVGVAWPTRQVRVTIPDSIPPVCGDEGYLEQVFRNLLGNAAKYGRTEVDVRVEVGADTVRVVVADDGPGVPPDDRARIFEPFFRASSTKRLPGAGIGLFVAHQLVEAMGGTLTVDDAQQGGAAFTVALRVFRESNRA